LPAERQLGRCWCVAGETAREQGEKPKAETPKTEMGAGGGEA